MSRMEPACIFCRIAAGEAPCHRVYEDRQVLAFMDIRPASVGHTLVIPKVHYPDIFSISDEAIATVISAARTIAVALRDELAPDGLNVVQANGAAAGQTVFHYHVHLLPRTEGSRLHMHGADAADPAGLERLAAALAARLDDARA